MSAIKGGYDLLGFADHTPFSFKDGYYSDFRMGVDEHDGYISSVRTLRDKYAGQIEIKVGLECEYYTDHIEWLRETTLLISLLRHLTNSTIASPHQKIWSNFV